MTTIHYCALYRSGARAACGSYMLADTDRFTSDPDSTDCDKCMATDEYKAVDMESTLIGAAPTGEAPSSARDWFPKIKAGFTPPHRKRPR